MPFECGCYECESEEPTKEQWDEWERELGKEELDKRINTGRD